MALTKQLRKAGQSDLGSGFVTVDRTWQIQHVYGWKRPDEVYLQGPLDGQGVGLKGGEKLIFRRSWPGPTKPPLELSQRLIHTLEVHWVNHRNAYCRIDENGDLEDVINVYQVPSDDPDHPDSVVTIKSYELFEFARLADMSLFFFYDFTRTDDNFIGWTDQERFSASDSDLYYHGGTMPGYGSYMNGRQIVEPPFKKRDISKRRKALRSPKKQFATFKAINMRDGKLIEHSCDPALTATYFEKESKKPLQISPAFFSAEVLHKYKADPAKYELAHRAISCRGAWHLKTYDVNKAGQVHTYLIYLADLPYREQLYWQSFNEEPKDFISDRAIKTDLYGEWSEEYDVIDAIKRLVRSLDEKPRVWWLPRGEALARTFHLPVTQSESEWAESILTLDQLLVEGFSPKPLRKIAEGGGRALDKTWGSLKLIEECLVALGVDEEDAKRSVSPLRALHELRSTVKGHHADGKKSAAVADALKKYGSLKGHFEAIAANCDHAMQAIIEKLPKVL